MQLELRKEAAPAEPRVLKSEAELSLAAAYRERRDRLPGSAAARERRDAAMASFEKHGLPHRRIEAWHYTDLRAQMRKAVALADAPAEGVASAALDAQPPVELESYRLVVADGYVQEALSDRGRLAAEGIEVVTLAEHLASADGAAILSAPEGAEADAVVALNAALASDGIVVRIPAGATPSRPIEIAHLTTGQSPTAWFARNAVVAGPGARATIVVSHHGPSGIAHHTNILTDLAIGEGGSLKVVDLQTNGDAAQHVATFAVRLAKDAALDHLAIVAGSVLSRLQGFVTVAGEGARLGAWGATMLGGHQHGDITLTVDHAAENSSSRMLYKDVVDGEAKGVFQGKIVVRPGAQKTDSRMMTRALLLADEASFNAKPELEIFADDVQCGHGATAGRIDEAMLFYFLARGIPRAEAETLLIQAFLAEAFESIGDHTIADAFEPLIAGWLGTRRLAPRAPA